MNLLTSGALIGVGAYLLTRSGAGSSASNAVAHVTTGDDAPQQGEVVAESPDGSELLVAGLDNAETIQLQVGNTVFTYAKVGEAVINAEGKSVPTPETAANAAAMGSTCFMGASCYMGRSRTPYTAKKWNIGKYDEALRIGMEPITVGECVQAGKAVADWRWRKVRGDVPKRANAPMDVGISAATLASTPCEIYKKVGYGEMSKKAAMTALDNYYADNAGYRQGEASLPRRNSGPYSRSRRHDS